MDKWFQGIFTQCRPSRDQINNKDPANRFRENVMTNGGK